MGSAPRQIGTGRPSEAPADPRPIHFPLNEVPGGGTRLVISGYQAIRPRWVGRFVFYGLYIPVTWIMQARMLAVLKRKHRTSCQWVATSCIYKGS